MKAIPDLDFAAKQITKPAVPPKPQLSSLPAPGSASSTPTLTPEHQPKTPPKPPSKDGIPRRGSGEIAAVQSNTFLSFLFNHINLLYTLDRKYMTDRFFRGVDSAALSNRKAVQVSAPSASQTKFPIRPWAHDQQQRRSYHHKQEREGEIPKF